MCKGEGGYKSNLMPLGRKEIGIASHTEGKVELSA
ncbi:hypothetical protein J2S16_001959 [Cytobacillus kochii]|nr:hypothetical protein [Cytobacillus kochii]